MATTVLDPYTQLADVVETVVRAEFDDEAYLTFWHDRIHESLGSDGSLNVAVSPVDETPETGVSMKLAATIQFYDAYDADVDPFQSVDPRLITNKAERLRHALEHHTVLGTSQIWFLTVGRVTYVDDPTGNKSRFEMEVSGTGNNSGLQETIG